MSQIVMVTGGTGYIGSWVVKGLVEKGYTVRMTVRDKTKKHKYAELMLFAEKSAGNLELWKTDLMKEGSFDAPAKGADAIMHIASPFTLQFNDPQKDLVDPAVLGTRNVLNAANRSTTVKKVVLTSSVAAVHGDNIDMYDQGLTEFTEEHFNTTSSLNHQPYSYSKVLAEKEAWKIAGSQNKWKLVVINPSFVLGPSVNGNTDSQSIKLMMDILKGKMFLGAADLVLGFVDVRDVAQAHILALENENAQGRHILAERTMNILDLSRIIKKKYDNKFLLPFMNAPKPLAMLFGRLFGLTPGFIKRNVGYPIRLNTTRSRKYLGLKYRYINDTVIDMVEHMQKQQLV